MNQLSDSQQDGLLPTVQMRLQQARLAQHTGAADSKRTAPPSGADPWKSFRESGLNVAYLQKIEAESIPEEIPRYESKAKEESAVQERAKKLAGRVPAKHRLKERSSKKSPHPDAQPENIYDPQTVYYPNLFVQGSGLGWSGSDSHAKSFIAQFVYDFVPPQDGNYSITAFPAIWGDIWAHANDQWWNSKDFHLSISCDLSASQPANYPSYTEEFYGDYFIGPLSQSLLDSEHGNATLPYSPIDFPEELNQVVFLQAGIPAAVWCVVDASVYAQGAGAYCGMNLGVGILFISAQLIST
jgi:hypothetical protein